MKRDMIDYHCHLLPALDDGAADLGEALEMARILSNSGFSTVYCTPHLIRGCYENDPSRVRQAVEAMQLQLVEADIPLQLLPGCEHYFDEFLPNLLPGALRIGASGYLLVEVPFRAGAELLHPLVAAFNRHGVKPLLAHPERCKAFELPVQERGVRAALSAMLGKRQMQELSPGSAVEQMLRQGCAFQGNLGSFAGLYGSEVRERALLFLRNGVYSCLGSDAHHSAGLRETLQRGIAAVASEVGEEGAAKLLRGFQA